MRNGYDERPRRRNQNYNNAEYPAYSSTTEPETRNGIIEGSTVSLRSAPSVVNSRVLGLLAPGTKVKILREVSGYYEVELDLDRKGFIPSSFCEEV